MYKVVKDFPERYDQNYTYKLGDAYPREGFTPPEGRADALCLGVVTDLNRTGGVYLKKEKAEAAPKKKPKS